MSVFAAEITLELIPVQADKRELTLVAILGIRSSRYGPGQTVGEKNLWMVSVPLESPVQLKLLIPFRQQISTTKSIIALYAVSLTGQSPPVELLATSIVTA